ncbi:hypothetical protein [Nocardia puris]|uniref:Uncharacterized protein n=1 Tax=Nocardia puris TaxID=208602 RepID=A0A366DMI6_9NOCA|nr:hypothetical protein [Nocardia puris]RBO91300.1 hypothetical protein DFR74_1042 [Nocardia puris]
MDDSSVSREIAESVVTAIKALFPQSDFSYGPNLRDADHEGLSPGSWSIDWEDGAPDEWAIEAARELRAFDGAFLEPRNHLILGVYQN